MQKSLFKKYILTFSLVSLGALIILGTVFMSVINNFWINEKKETLFSEARLVSKQITETGGTNISQVLSILSGESGREMFITDRSGRIVASSGRFLVEGKTISTDKYDIFLDGENSFISDFGSMLPVKFLGVSVPIYSRSKQVVYVVFNIISSDEMWEYTKSFFKIYILTAIVIMGLLLLLAYVMASRMVRPLREMADASRKMSRGDFSTYIKVDRQDELGELAVAFNNMTKSLAVSEQQRKGFVANVSHELKTPMTTISGFIDGIIDGTIPDEERLTYLEIVSNETKRLSRIVVSMLNLSKLESGEISVKPTDIDVSDMILNVMLGFEQKIDSKHIEVVGLDVLNAVHMNADKDLMYQVVYNLIENAIKYTPENGTISVTDKTDENFSCFTIKNTGKGISERDLPFIFDRFYKVDKSHGTDRNGTGLGLYLVKTIIGIHGGKITVKSLENQYCEFTVTMPNTNSKGEISNGTKRKK